MSVILDQMNSAGHGFVEFAVPMLVQSSLLIVILLLVDVLLRKKVRAVFRYWIWLLVLLKFVLPTSLSTPVSLGHWLGGGFAWMDVGPMIAAHKTAGIDPDRHAPLAVPVAPGGESSRPMSETVGSPGVPVAHITWQGIVFLVWLVVVMVMVLLLIQRSLFVRGLVARARKADGSMNDMLAHCCHSMGVRRKVGLRISTHTTSPAVCRLFIPVILLPQNLLSSLEASQLPVVLMHELAHLKRLDLWVNFGQTLLQILYFYNPLLWLANTTIRRVREQAVDEAVLVAMGEKAQLYPQTLVNVAKLAFRGPMLSLRLIGVVESKNLFEWRIRTMLNRPIPKSSKLGVVGTIVIFALAAVLLPMARAQKVDVSSKPVATENEGKPAKSLCQAAADGDIEQVKALIAKGADVNKGDRRGNTPLHYAAVSGDKQTIELLLSKSADINAKNRDGRTPLFEAMKSAATGRKEVVELLVSKGAKIPAFHLAAYMGDMGKLKKFLQEGVNINTIADCNLTALHAAANSGKKDIVEFLINKGANIDAKDLSNLTPLYYAAIHNYEDIADLLLAKGADVNAKGKDSYAYYTLLNFAIWDRNRDAIKLLIRNGADVNAKDDYDYTPLFYASWENDKDTVELLISKGADINAEDKDGRTPYYWAAMEGRKDMVELLTAKGATPVSSIHVAARAGDLAKVKSLIEAGADVNAKDKPGQTPLFWAVLGDNNDVAKFLIAKGADVNAKDTLGRTPLNFLVYSHGKEDMVEFLISKGADVNAKDSRTGVIPLHSASFLGQKDVAELLIAKGSNVNAKSTGGMTPSYFAAKHGQKNVAELLISKGADINIKDNNGTAPLHIACLYGHKDVVELLVAKGADMNAKDDKGQTALSLATAQGHQNVVELLKKHGAKE